MTAATHGARAGFFFFFFVYMCVCALASVLVEQTGGYSKQACERAAVWVNMSQGERAVWS